MRTQEEIKKMIDRIEKTRRALPEYDFFGDPNWKGMDAKTDTLEWVLGEREDEEIADIEQEE